MIKDAGIKAKKIIENAVDEAEKEKLAILAEVKNEIAGVVEKSVIAFMEADYKNVNLKLTEDALSDAKKVGI